MSPKPVSLAEWKAADKAAGAAEDAYFAAVRNALFKRGAADPPESQWRRVQALREEADRLFALAMTDVHPAQNDSQWGALD